ncbi:MAG: VOC family protein, partial [Chitinophagaceae bacterium]
AYNVETKEEINPLFEELKYKGVRVLKEPEDTPYGGYNFIIADPEDNVFEFAWNPFLVLDDKGDVITHHPIE